MDIELDYADFEHNSLFTLFKFDIQLTENGIENLKDVLDALKKSTVDEAYFNYLAAYAKKEFEEASELSADDNVVSIATNMKYYNSKDYLFGTSCFLEFDESDIRDVIRELNKPKFNIFLVSEGCDAEIQTKFFDFGYTEKNLPTYCTNAWKNRAVKEEFALPVPGEVEKKSHKLFYNSKMKVSVCIHIL
jgi:secreted Zn-dependent insulinase-like peptidase